MNGTSKGLVGVLKDSTSISFIYQGEKLVWGKKDIVANFSGKFTNNSSSADYFYYANEFQGSIKSIPVDETTKEFSCNVKDIPFLTQNHNIKEITAFPDTSAATSFESMFSHCEGMTYLNVDCFNTENVVNMINMFASCYELTELDLSGWNTKSLVQCTGLFGYCGNLTTLNLSGWDVSKVRSFYGIFSNCYQLETLNIDGWDFSNGSSFSSTFSSCRNLKNVIGSISGIKANLDLSAAPLTNDSAMAFINGLANTSISRTLTFSTATYNTLTDEQKAIASSKKWTVTSK